MGQESSVAEGTPWNGGWPSSQMTSASNPPPPPAPHQQAAVSPASDFLMGLELPSPVSATCHVERGRTSDGARGALLAQSTARPAWAQRPPLSALGSKNEPLAPLMHRQCAPPGMQSAHHFANDHTAVSASSNNVPFSIRSSAPLFGSLPRMGSSLSLEGRSGRMLSAGIHGAASQSGGRFASGWPDSSEAPTGVNLSARASGTSINPIGRTAVATAPGGRGEVAAAASSRGLVSAVDDWLDSLEAKPSTTKAKKDAKKDLLTSVAPRSMVNVFGSAASGRTSLSQPVPPPLPPAPRARGPFGV